MQREHRIDLHHAQPNVVVRVTPDDVLEGVGVLPRSAVLVDLVAEREDRVAAELLRATP